jgi:hypothetical protein
MWWLREQSIRREKTPVTIPTRFRRLSVCVRHHNCGVQFSADLRDRVADETITVSYRLWSRPKVKVGGLYRSGSVMIEIDEIELLPFSSITEEDLARTGEPDLETLRRRAAHAGPIQDDTILFRVEFHVVKQQHPTR